MSNMKLVHTFITKNLLFLVPEAEVWYEHLPENDLKHCFHICPNQEKYVTAWKAQDRAEIDYRNAKPDDFRRMFDSYHTGSSEDLQEALDFHHGTLLRYGGAKHVADVSQLY